MIHLFHLSVPCRARCLNYTREAGRNPKIMPTTTEILVAEQAKDRLSIQFYSEGIFYKAYQQSAWLACLLLNRFTVKKKLIKKAGQDVISIGFPKTSLSKWTAGRRTYVSDDKAVIYINESEYKGIQDKDFNKWKDTISNECGPTWELVLYVMHRSRQMHL